MNDKIKSEIQELLAKLYLRLNGYLSSGFIIHSEEYGKIKSEVDILAVRFPHSTELERGVRSDEILETSNTYIDFLVCEVKSNGQKIRFNKPLINNIKNLQTILSWFGALSSEEIMEHEKNIHKLFQIKNFSNDKPNKYIISEKNLQIRSLVFKPETRTKSDNQPFFIGEKDIFNYISSCVKPEIERSTCATRYDVTSWGKEFHPLISFFKSEHYEKNSNITGLYDYLEKIQTGF